jgi:hypothetical protein
MKRNAFICLIIFLINAGFYGVYQVMIFRAKWNASILIRNINHPERMQVLKLTQQEAKCYNEDEITYHGQLFDVAKRIVFDDSVVLYLYADNDEQNVLNELVNYFQSDDSCIIPMSEKIFRIKILNGNQDQISKRIILLTLLYPYTISCHSILQKTHQITVRHDPVPTPPPEFLAV